MVWESDAQPSLVKDRLYRVRVDEQQVLFSRHQIGATRMSNKAPFHTYASWHMAAKSALNEIFFVVAIG